MTQTATALWRIRTEDAQDQGRPISLARLSQGIQDGVWSDTDEVLGPQDRSWQLVGEHPLLEEFVPRKPIFRSRAGEEAEMDMTPMIDVTFQLLIFFMIAATYIVQKTLDLPQPQQNQEGASTVTMEQLEKNNIMVKVTRDGSITVQKQPVKPEDLAAVFRREVKQSDGAEVVLDVDDEVPHETVVKIIDAAGGAQVEKIQFVSRVGGGGQKSQAATPGDDQGARVVPRRPPRADAASSRIGLAVTHR
jgi:biopolymer transport protein ExbD